MNTLKRNCTFETETPFCASKSPKFACILSCKTVFISNKHNNDCKDEQTLNKKKKNIETMRRLCRAPLRQRPPIQRLTLQSHSFAHLPNRLQIMFFLVLCSVDGWQTTTLEGLGHLWGVRSWRLNV